MAATLLKNRLSPKYAVDEGRLTKTMEYQTARIPSSFWLFAAGGSILASAALRASGRGNDANFVGQWAPTFLMIGLYNKIVKVLGSD